MFNMCFDSTQKERIVAKFSSVVLHSTSGLLSSGALCGGLLVVVVVLCALLLAIIGSLSLSGNF